MDQTASRLPFLETLFPRSRRHQELQLQPRTTRGISLETYIYIYIHIIQASLLIYLDKVESRDEGCFSRARHRHAEECQTAFAHPFDAISELLSPPLLEILDFPRYAILDESRFLEMIHKATISLSFLEKKKKKIDREIGVVRYSIFSHLAEIRKKSIPSNLTLKIPAKQSDSNIIYSTTRETFVETKVPSERQDRSRQAPG